MGTHVYPSLSLDEYLRVEEASPERHEYVAGDLYLMVGVTARHSRITRRVAAALDRAAARGPCDVFYGDVKLRVANDRVYYPDLMTVCVPVPGNALVVTEPCVVVEVTSPITRRIDRGEKLFAYQQIPSLRAYLIVEQRERRVDRWSRDAAGLWQSDSITDATDGRIAIPCPETVLTLDDLYDGIELGDEES